MTAPPSRFPPCKLNSSFVGLNTSNLDSATSAAPMHFVSFFFPSPPARLSHTLTLTTPVSESPSCSGNTPCCIQCGFRVMLHTWLVNLVSPTSTTATKRGTRNGDICGWWETAGRVVVFCVLDGKVSLGRVDRLELGNPGERRDIKARNDAP